MRKLLLTMMAAAAVSVANAQISVVATFDTLTLPKADTFYVNFSAPGTDVGFDDGYLHFPCVYDTAFGFSFWSSGFAYSNMTDSVTSGFGNQYAAKTAKGYNGSANYATAYSRTNYVTFNPMPVPLGGGVRAVDGFYATNSTYAYNSMRDGDAFAKKFGGVSGNDADWFLLSVHGYSNGVPVSNSVDFYLADFRDTNNANDYIVGDWQWVDLSPLGQVDSLQFELNSSDTGSFGMNTPAYFCMDNMTTQTPTDVNDVTPVAVKVYPNPAGANITIETSSQLLTQIVVMDMAGRIAGTYTPAQPKTEIPLNNLVPGNYLLQLKSAGQTQVLKFTKQ